MEKNDNTHNIHLSWAKSLLRIKMAFVLAVVLLVIVGGFIIYHTVKDSTMTITKDTKIDITPMQILSIERIGEWEFLSISDEEIIDTTRSGFLSDAQLVNIYYGTLRLGVNLSKTEKGWIKSSGDTIIAKLPPVQLLDEDFIDETRTRSFIEKGNWKPADRAALHDRARRTMRTRCLTPAVWQSAEQNAETQMTKLLHSMGFNYIKVITSHTSTNNK